MIRTPSAPEDPLAVSGWLYERSGRLAFDVGGNTGTLAARLAERFERVMSFEPADESYVTLHETASAIPNLTALQVAVSDHDGDLELAVQGTSIRTGQLTSPDNVIPETQDALYWGPIVTRRTVRCRTLDSLADEHGMPDFVKIDVEGHDAHVVRGGLGMFKTRPAFYIEIHSVDLGREVLEMLEPISGEIRRVGHPGYSSDHLGYENHYWLISE